MQKYSWKKLGVESKEIDTNKGYLSLKSLFIPISKSHALRRTVESLLEKRKQRYITFVTSRTFQKKCCMF